MPQFDPNFFASQIFWLFVTFAVLYFALSRVALPRIGAVLEAREQRIANDLDRAAELRAEAEEIMAQYEKGLAEARARAAEITRQAEAAVAQEMAARQARLNAELTSRVQEAESRIAAAKAAAMANVQSVAAEAARGAVERLLGETVPLAEAEHVTALALKTRARG
jgi:F-type H+-transporting ATPase subunit b